MLLHDAPFMPPGLGRGRRAITSTSPVTTADAGIVIDATSGTYDVTTATAASTFGSGFSFGLYNSGSGTVTFNPNGSETVRSPSGTATTLALVQGQGAFIVCDGTNWDVVCDTGIPVAPTTPVVVYDNAFTIKDDVDPTKTLVFNVGPQSTGADFIFSLGGQTADRTLSVPVLTGGDTLLTENAAQTVTALKSFYDTAIAVVGNGDVTKRLMFQVDTQAAGFTLTLDVGGQSASRTLLVPVLAGTDTIAALGVANVFTENLSQTGAKTFSTGTGAVSLNGTTTVISGKQLNAADTTDATTISTGAFITAGGVGITKALWVGGLANIAGAATFQNNITQSGATTLSTGTGQASMNGNVVVASGKTITAVSGIIFSNETLSTYDEGTWTPTIAGDATAGTQTYSTQTGTYTRIGRLVTLFFNMQMTNKDGATAGNVVISGSPFTPASSRSGGGIAEYAQITFAGFTQLTLRTVGTLSNMYLGTGATGGAFGNVAAAGIANTTQLTGSIQFEV